MLLFVVISILYIKSNLSFYPPWSRIGGLELWLQVFLILRLDESMFYPKKLALFKRVNSQSEQHLWRRRSKYCKLVYQNVSVIVFWMYNSWLSKNLIILYLYSRAKRFISPILQVSCSQSLFLGTITSAHFISNVLFISYLLTYNYYSSYSVKRVSCKINVNCC
jgi:hypothetical protein